MTVTYDTAYFIERANKIHGEGRFDYSLTEYTASKNRLIITCPKHGKFEQIAFVHLGGAGCIKCSKNRTLEKPDFIKNARKVHADKFCYEASVYVNSKTKLDIKCNACDTVFSQTPNDHTSGCGCPNCAGSYKLDTQEFIKRSSEVHGGFYDYSKTVYRGAAYKLTVICPEHGEFKQKAQYHMAGMRCLKCAQAISVWSRSEYVKICKRKGGKAELYIVKMASESEVFYKIGITSQGVSTRLNRGAQMPYRYKVIRTISGDAGFIWDLEKKLHSINRVNKYKPDLDFAGSTECFTEIPKGIYELIDRLSDTAQLPLIA